METMEELSESRAVFRVETGETGDIASSYGAGGGIGQFVVICSVMPSRNPAVGGLTGETMAMPGAGGLLISVIVSGARRVVAGAEE